MAHSIEPVLPFNIMLATFLVPNIDAPLTTDNLLVICACQLKKYPTNLAAICNCILASCFASVCQFEKQHACSICDYNFKLSTLVLVHNTRSDMDKTRSHYFGPMVVLQCNCNSAYRLGKLDGAISKLCYATFRLIPYHTCLQSYIPVTHIVDDDDLASLELEDILVSNQNNSLT